MKAANMAEKKTVDPVMVFYVLKCKKGNGGTVEEGTFKTAKEAVQTAHELAERPTYHERDQFLVFPAWKSPTSHARNEGSVRVTMSVWALRGNYPRSMMR